MIQNFWLEWQSSIQVSKKILSGHDFHLKWFQLLCSIAAKTVGTARLATSAAGGPDHGDNDKDNYDDSDNEDDHDG